MDRPDLTERNRIAWEADAYRAWTVRYGAPEAAAAEIARDPRRVARRVLPHLGDPAGLSVANPLGSHGRLATALALLGARVSVFDLSASNARFARELAAAAGAPIEYLVGDFEATAPGRAGRFDAVAMELGIVHYFAELAGFVAANRTLVAPGGRLVLCEFHPLLRKAVAVESGAPRLAGDYFRDAPEEADTPYGAFLDGAVPDCLIRRWTLGEIVTAFARGGFAIERLDEHPSPEAPRLPGTFTLVARAA